MKRLTQLFILFWFLVFSGLVRADPVGTPADVLKNTKETESKVVSKRANRWAHRHLPLSEGETVRFKQVFAELIQNHDWQNACEPDFLNQLVTGLKKASLPSQPASVKAALILFREQNWIDDLSLKPLLAFYPAWKNIDAPLSSEGSLCPSSDFMNIYSLTWRKFGRKTKMRQVKETIDALDPTKEPRRIAWLKVLASSGYHSKTNRTFSDIFESLETAKNHSLVQGALSEASEYLTEKNRRLDLYKTYSGLQINLLSERWVTFTHRMMADSAELRINFKDHTNEIYLLSPEEQDRMARKMLHKEIEDLRISTLFSGTAPTVEDAITAAVETGAISPKDIQVALSVPEMWNPKIPSWVKTFKTIERFGLPATLFIPPPGNVIASLAVALVDALYVSKFTKTPVSADDAGISIF